MPGALYDMHGNVWELCRDGKRQYTDQPQRDPVGPLEESAARVERGGAWAFQAQRCRSAYRNAYLPGIDWVYGGLRLSAGQEQERVTAEPSVPKRQSRG